MSTTTRPRSTPAAADLAPTTRYGIVLGAPRSGTTYLMSVLNTLPQVEALTGTVLPIAVPHVVAQGTLSCDTYQALAIGFERALDDYIHSGRYHNRALALQKWWRAPSGLSGLWRALRGERTCDLFIYKEPFLSFAPGFVLDAFPNGRIVHIYRDGRDVANSLVETYDVLTDASLHHLRASEMRLGRRVSDRFVPWWVADGREDEFLAATPFVRAIWMWAAMMERCHAAFSRPEVKASGQVHLLRYEDFVTDPVRHGEALLAHFGTDPTPSFRRQLAKARRTSIGKYEQRPAAERREAERVAGPELRRYGYL